MTKVFGRARQELRMPRHEEHTDSVGHATASPTDAQQRETFQQESYPSTFTVALP
jgi:hypothetical protein